MRIGVFDSGLGGLTVLKTLIKMYPCNEYIYYGDTKNLPYGEKAKEKLFELSLNIIKFFETKKVDLIIIACGTISSCCFKELKSITNIPIYDIITPTINYLNKLNYQNIAIFATKRTIDTHIFKKNLHKKQVLEIKTSEFVPMIENKNLNLNIIKNYCLKIIDYDILVLGCTHYPIIEKEIKSYLNNKTSIINMANCLVNSLNLTNNNSLKVNLYFSKLDDNLLENINSILDIPYNIIENDNQ